MFVTAVHIRALRSCSERERKRGGGARERESDRQTDRQRDRETER